MSLQQFLKEYYQSSDKRIHLSPDIPQKILSNAAEAFKFTRANSEVVAVIDNTTFGSGKDGIVFLSDGLILREAFAEPKKISYEKLGSLFATGRVVYSGSQELYKFHMPEKEALESFIDLVGTWVVGTSQHENDVFDVFVKEASKVISSKIHISPNIPLSKMKGAANSYAGGISPKDTLVLIDDTLMGGAGEGLVLTKNGLYSKALLTSSVRTSWSSVRSIYFKGSSLRVNDKEIQNFIHQDSSDLKELSTSLSLLLMCSRAASLFSKNDADSLKESKGASSLSADNQVAECEPVDEEVELSRTAVSMELAVNVNKTETQAADKKEKTKIEDSLNANVYLRKNLPDIAFDKESNSGLAEEGEVAKKNIFVAPNIPDGILNAAIKAFGYDGELHSVIGVYDNALIRAGSSGLLFTGERLIYKVEFEEPKTVYYKDIESVELEQTEDDKGIAKYRTKLTIDGKSVFIDKAGCKYVELTRLLEDIVNKFDIYEEQEQYIPLEAMASSVKESYIKAVVNMAYADDGVIDEKEFSEILLLMTRIDLTPESRFALRSYMTASDAQQSLEDLLFELAQECPAGQISTLHVSLIKDMLNIHLCKKEATLDNFHFLQKNRELFVVTENEIDLVYASIINDRNILQSEYSDEKVKGAMKELSAKAAAVGTPLAAIYLSGSVVGMSAAGMTSGLATLGMGGVLGLSSMATGIGAAALVGVFAYKGVRKLTGADELTKNAHRELMLNEIIKQTQSTISLLIQDVNFIAGKLNEMIGAHELQNEKMAKLAGMLKQMTMAGSVLNQRVDFAQSNAAKLRCASSLSIARLEALTAEPTKKRFYDYIVNCYEPIADEEKDGAEKYVLKKGLDLKTVETLSEMFHAIGYFEVGAIITSGASNIASKLKSNIMDAVKKND